MHYTTSIEILLSRHKVIDLFDNPANMYHWQPAMKSYEITKGEAGQPDAQATLTYAMGKRDFIMKETVLKRHLPKGYEVQYETKNVKNILHNFFEEKGDGKTLWTTKNEFKFTGFMAILAIFMGKSFRKQTLKSMQQFKAFAEEQSIK